MMAPAARHLSALSQSAAGLRSTGVCARAGGMDPRPSTFQRGVSSAQSKASKVVSSAAEAVKDIKDGDKLLVGGFGLCGIPENLIAAVRDLGAKDLTIVSNNCGVDDFGLGVLLKTRQVRLFLQISGLKCKNSWFACFILFRVIFGLLPKPC
jgi:hypothetical protein